MGLEVPETIISDDYSRYMVEQFDFDTSGEQLGFVDMCAITAAPAASVIAINRGRLPILRIMYIM